VPPTRGTVTSKQLISLPFSFLTHSTMLITKAGCTARQFGLLHTARVAPSRFLVRAHYGQLPVVTTIEPRAKHAATPPPPTSQPAPPSPHLADSQLTIYEGPYSQTAKRLKLFSVSSLGATVALCPFIFILDAGISTGMRGSLAAAGK
jgi:hypothetical protein